MAIDHLGVPWRRWVAGLGLLGCVAAAGPAGAQDDPPGRVGRLAEVQGVVSYYDDEQGAWQAALRNRPLTTGDRLATGRDARAELRVGSTVLRIGAGTELELQRVDDQRMQFRLHAGSLALRVASREVADEIVVATLEANLRPTGSGHFRVDRRDGTTFASSWRGALRVDDEFGFDVDPGRRVELWREGPGRSLRHTWLAPLDDAFAAWIADADRRDERTRYTYVPPEMTGAEDLDGYGRWDQHPEYGAVWIPQSVPADWAPYRFGHWAWVQPWGWTWVDDAAWGFAPFHYGRWVHWRGRWCWTPGAAVARPIFAPALVAWVRGPRVSVGVDIGWGWIPLAPAEPYVPHYRHSPGYRDRVDPPWPPRGRPRPPREVPTGPVMYGNQGVPGGITVVPSTVLQQGSTVRVPHDGPKDGRGAMPVLRDRPLQPAEPPRPIIGHRPDGASSRDERPRPPPPSDRSAGPPPVRHVPGGAVPAEGRTGDAEGPGRRPRDPVAPRPADRREEPSRPPARRDEPPQPPVRAMPEAPAAATPQGPMPTRPGLRGGAAPVTPPPPVAPAQPPQHPQPQQPPALRPRPPAVQPPPPAAATQPPATAPRPPRVAAPPAAQPQGPAARPQAPPRERESDRERERNPRADEGRSRAPESKPSVRDRQQTQ